MEKRLEEWSKVYPSVGISQLTRFIRTVTNRMYGIVSRATFHISSGKIEGMNSFIKALRLSAFGYQDFDYFAYLIWEQTHKDSKYGIPSLGSSKRHYSRKEPYNKKRLKQTVFKFAYGSDKETVRPADCTPKDLDPVFLLVKNVV